MSLNVSKIRADFPLLQRQVYDKPLIYLDNAATTQKPLQVVEAVGQYYSSQNSNIHRGNHLLSLQATEAFEEARKTVARFINAAEAQEIVFTRGTTESVNLVASGIAKCCLEAGDEILISALEHHSNLVPWQQVCLEKGAHLKVLPVDENGNLLLDELDKHLSSRTRLVAITQVSNALGIVVDLDTIVSKAHQMGIPVFVDGAQGIQHMRVDVQASDFDFYAFSGHKIYGPMGIGVLYGKRQWLEKLPPYQFGGEMIQRVRFHETTFNELPFRFEAGTPNVEGALGLAVALDYLTRLGLDEIFRYEEELYGYAVERLASISGFKQIGKAPKQCSVISFLMEGVHPYDTGTILDQFGIAVRTGHHCAQPLMEHLRIPGTVRASLAFYNTREEIDYLAEKLEVVKSLFL
ncbi:MAG: aminotransferase class V-fold PLP-dependent enzyme [Bacteroidales bacterium]